MAKSESSTQIRDLGATVQNTYHNRVEEICAVPKNEILDNSRAAMEEVWQYSIGGFLFSGAFWLGFERLMTEGPKDVLFLSCIAPVICGSVLAITGYRQARRRVTRLAQYLPDN